MFVAPAKLESLFGMSELVEQIFVYGDARLSNVVAIVVPSSLLLSRIEPLHSRTSPTDDELRKSLTNALNSNENNILKTVTDLLKADFREIGQKNELKSWEFPNVIIVEPEPFSNWNGLLSSIGKLCRPELIRKYRPQIESRLNLDPLGNEAPISAPTRPSSRTKGTFSPLRNLMTLLIFSIIYKRKWRSDEGPCESSGGSPPAEFRNFGKELLSRIRT